MIAVADVVMSLDNVIAVAAVADGSLALLVFGLGVSIPAIVAGANIIMAMLNYFPLIIWAGAGLLGWIAGDVIASDPIIDGLRGVVRRRRARKDQAHLRDRRHGGDCGLLPHQPGAAARAARSTV